MGAEMDGDALPIEHANNATPPQKMRLSVRTAACANDGGADTAHRNRRILCGGGSTSLLSASLPSLICIPSVRLHNYRGFYAVLSYSAPSDAIYTLKLLPSPILADHRLPPSDSLPAMSCRASALLASIMTRRTAAKEGIAEGRLLADRPSKLCCSAIASCPMAFPQGKTGESSVDNLQSAVRKS